MSRLNWSVSRGNIEGHSLRYESAELEQPGETEEHDADPPVRPKAGKHPVLRTK